MFLSSLLFFLLSFLISLGSASCPDNPRDYWETGINRDCGQVENGAKFQQIGAMQWGYKDANGHLPYSYNTKVCLTESPGCNCIRLSSAEDHKVNRFYLATGFFIAIYSDDNCKNDMVTVGGQSGTLFGEYKIRSYRAWKH
ncbi:hypothetical protein P171DRAFT_480246 [Karstenula rhodostoma CBS 690.94]|uniref:Secreted protein n=1 Tax=Karstenula rhodostoma CBS 690.94 TaxID=1392251 RepID=A0A9P4UH21_9PLEO|nr:hypothetical protein P171DRAFT_480246 [Karstenula rhodostoma CBS 690.94]